MTPPVITITPKQRERMKESLRKAVRQRIQEIRQTQPEMHPSLLENTIIRWLEVCLERINNSDMKK